MIKDKGMEYIHSQMDVYMMGSGIRISNMESEGLHKKMERSRLGNGRMEYEEAWVTATRDPCNVPT